MSEDTSRELDSDGSRYYQLFLGVLCWEIEIVRVDILLEVTLTLYHCLLSRIGHLQHIYLIFEYLKESTRKYVFFPTHTYISDY